MWILLAVIITYAAAEGVKQTSTFTTTSSAYSTLTTTNVTANIVSKLDDDGDIIAGGVSAVFGNKNANQLPAEVIEYYDSDPR